MKVNLNRKEVRSLIIKIQADITITLKGASVDKVKKKLEKLKPYARKTKIGIVREILKNSNTPLHIKDIIRTAKNAYKVDLHRDTIVSQLVKDAYARKDEFRVIRTAPNTFTLVSSDIGK